MSEDFVSHSFKKKALFVQSLSILSSVASDDRGNVRKHTAIM